MVSVIVPVYKAEKYLHRCINSILAQTYTDFELLLVDDGSPDNSGVICDEYAAKDSRIRVFHKPNGGVSSARNLGLDNARGKWITFVDSDDYVHSDFLCSLYEKHDADLIVSSFEIVGSEEKWNSILEDVGYDENTLKEHIERLSLLPNFQVPWGKLFKRSIISDNHMSFDEKLHSGEDTLFVLNYLIHTNKLRLCNKPYYYYERGNFDGLSQSIFSVEHHFYALEVFANVIGELGKHLERSTRKIYIAYMKIYCTKLINSIYHSRETMVVKWKGINNMCKNEYLKLLFSDNQTPYRKKIRLFHFLMSKKLSLFACIYLHIYRGRIYW